MKIAIVTPLTGAYSGAHEYAVQLKRGLGLIGNEVEIFSIAGIGKCPIPDTTQLFINSLKNNTNVLKEFDAIHFTSVCENGKGEPRFLGDSTRFKYFVTIHSCEHDLQSANGWQGIVKNAYGIIFTSESNRRYYVKNYPKLVGMHNSYVIDMPYVPSFSMISPKQNLAICTSRFISYKKNREFLKTAKHFPDIQFTQLSTITTNGKNSYINGLITKSYLESTNRHIKGFKNARIIDYAKQKDPKKVKTDYLKDARYLVDLSSFDIDKDRVQYTTLEAMDYCCVPIFHKNFFGSTLKHLRNGYAVETEEDVKNAIQWLEVHTMEREYIVQENLKFLMRRYGQSNAQRYQKTYSRK